MNKEQLIKQNKLLKKQIEIDKKLSTNKQDSEVLLFNSSIERFNNYSLFKSHNRTRDLYKIYGYEKDLETDHYIARFSRQDIAKRIVEAYPEACWSTMPKITDEGSTTDQSNFEKSVEEVFNHSKLKIHNKILRLDTLSGIGQFGVLFIGVADGKSPDQELDSNLSLEDILYIMPYGQSNINIVEFDEDPMSERYGLPHMYQISTGGYGDNTEKKQSDIKIHHTRVLHIAENTLENDVFGTPRLKPVFNRLVDLEKIVGGGSETFFLNSRGGLHMDQETNTQLYDNDASKLNDRIQEYENNLSRVLRTKGFKVNTLNHESADPKNHFEILISLISATTKIPKRILIGSERGELSSTQDENNWSEKVSARQNSHCKDNILIPFINWFIKYGILPEPKDGKFTIEFEDLKKHSAKEVAEVAVLQTQALKNYLDSNGSEHCMPPKQLFEDLLKLDYKEEDLPDANDYDDEIDIDEEEKEPSS